MEPTISSGPGSVAFDRIITGDVNVSWLADNALPTGLGDSGALELNRDVATAAGVSESLFQSEEGREVLGYMMRCALDRDATATFVSDDQAHVLGGGFGLAPEWTRRALTVEEKNLVSACLFAHMNGFGRSAAASLRFPGHADVGGVDATVQQSAQGAVYGRYFTTADEAVQLYSCLGEGAHSAAELNRGGSDCEAGSALCATVTGRCEDVCDSYRPGLGWSECWGGGVRYREVGNTFTNRVWEAIPQPNGNPDQERMDYDHRDFATELLDLDNWVSADGEFTTEGATPDEAAGSCWASGPNYNRWFRFTAATSYIDIQVRVGDTEGTMRFPMLAIWDAGGTEQACARFSSGDADLGLQLNNLTPGNTYYISVDNDMDPLVAGSFALAANDQQPADYDNRASAFELLDLNNWASADAAFTTVGATPDEAKGSCWNTGPSYNRWFRFTATTNYIDLRVRTGGDVGTLRYPTMALWDAAGAELDCASHTTGTAELDLQRNDLTPGQTYYVSVDQVDDTYMRGTFALSANAVQPADYDNRATALDLLDLNNWVSEDGEFTTQYATGDEAKGSCWSTGPNYNRWFRFQATTNYISVTARTGGTDGALRYPYMALWDGDGNQLACARFLTASNDLTLALGDLTPGEFYYISVDNFNGNAFRGTFGLSVTDQPIIDYDYMGTAFELTDRDKWNSVDEEFSTVGATGDQMRGSCWDSGPAFNRWFRFTALSQYMNVTARTGGTEGTLRYPYLALWDALGNELGCRRFITSTDDLNVEIDTLTMGEDYFISLDNYADPFFSGTFSMSLDMDYDNQVHAVELADTDNWFSNPGDYSTTDGTPDGLKGSCWNNGPNHNRWFKFTADSNYVDIQVLTDGAEGTVQYPWVALWDSAGTEVGCKKFTLEDNDTQLKRTNLVVGETYYIAVDNFIGGYFGDFTLGVNTVRPADYDYKIFALDIPDLTDFYSGDEAYSTVGATPDDVKGSCWNNGPNYNRWFQFTPTSNHLNIKLLTGGTEGTVQFPFLALWDSAGNEIECRKFAVADSDLQIHRNDITPGETYYVAVDNFRNTAYQGTFSLSVSDVVPMDYDYRASALELMDLNNWYSGDAAFSTIDGTRDETRASCWNNGPNFNRWFTFIATTTSIDITMYTGGTEGNQRYSYLALWDAAGAELGCDRFAAANDDLNVVNGSLIPGERYYISVDTFGRQEYRGDFALRVNDM